jgi:hypothetical protein
MEAVSLCAGAARTFVQDAEDKGFGCRKVADWQRAATTRHNREKNAGLSGLDARTKWKAGKFMQSWTGQLPGLKEMEAFMGNLACAWIF